MKFLKITYLIFLIFLNGCGAGTFEQSSATADYGNVQNPEECKTISENQIKKILKDPLSAIFKHDSSCAKGSLGAKGLPDKYGYLQTGSVNSKNVSGSYTGFTDYRVLIKNGVAIRFCIVNRGKGLCGPRQ